jgi:hypothetical protein
MDRDYSLTGNNQRISANIEYAEINELNLNFEDLTKG